jgi:hypothetical protein
MVSQGSKIQDVSEAEFASVEYWSINVSSNSE